MVYYTFFCTTAEVLAAELMFLYSFKKRKGFVFRLIAVICCCLLLAAFFPRPQLDIVWKTVLDFIKFFGMFVLTVLGMIFCFKGRIWTILSVCTAGYAVQHLTNRFYRIVYIIFPIFDKIPLPFEPFFRMIVLFPIVYVVMFFIFARPAARNNYEDKGDKKMNAVSFGIVILCMVVTRVTNLEEPTVVATLAESIYAILCCLFALIVQFELYKYRQKDMELYVMNRLLKQSESEYERWKSSIDIINVKCHDLKHNLQKLKDYYSKKSVSEIEEAVSFYDSVQKTGNEALDILLAEKSMFCEKEKITFCYIIDGKHLSFMEQTDVYFLFSNIIENAIEGVIREAEPQRVINLIVQRNGNMLSIHEENCFSGTITFEQGLPVTTKKDKNYHGFGTKSIQMLVEKYGGQTDIFTRDNVFYLNILFELNVENKAEL